MQVGGPTDMPVGKNFSMYHGEIVVSDDANTMKSRSEPVKDNDAVSFTHYARTVKPEQGPFCGVVSSDYSTSLK